jgi:hypothetical protein
MTTTRDDPVKLLELLIKAVGPAKVMELLTKAVGSKAEAHRLVDAANVRGSSGRPTGYFADAHVLYAVEMLE